MPGFNEPDYLAAFECDRETDGRTK